MMNLAIGVLLSGGAARVGRSRNRLRQPARSSEVDSTLTPGSDGGYARTGMMIMPSRDAIDLRLRDLRTLSVVLRERNLTRAAELLDTTQPSISKILARLRDHFGDPLVIRDGHAMQLTPRAVAMTEPLRNLLAASDGLCAATPAF